MNYTILNRDELPHDENTYEFEGFQHQNTEVSFIWVDMPPGGSVRLHKHPYKEIFIIQEGISTFAVDSTPPHWKQLWDRSLLSPRTCLTNS